MRLVVIALFAFGMLNVLGILNSVPKAYATTTQCSFNYYFDDIESGNSPEYGNYGVVEPTSWNYDGDTSGHEVLWVDSVFTSNYFVQAGVGAGKLGTYSYDSTRYPYLEYDTPSAGDVIIVANTYPIPGSDLDKAEVYAASYSSGQYTYEIAVYSPYYNHWWSTSANVGSYGTGTLLTGSETYYSTTSHENCDLYDNYHTSLAYSAAYSTSPSWSSWTSASINLHDGNYSYYESSVTSWETYLTS